MLSDTPSSGWPVKDFWPLRVPLLPDEVTRYRELCRDASAVFSDILTGLSPGLTEHELAGRLAEGLRAYGAQPVVLLVGSDERLQNYKHPIPQAKRIEKRVMAVACPRRHGVYANITRFVSFGETEAQARDYTSLLEIERAIFDATQHGVLVRDLFTVLEEAYAEAGFEGRVAGTSSGRADGLPHPRFCRRAGERADACRGLGVRLEPVAAGGSRWRTRRF